MRWDLPILERKKPLPRRLARALWSLGAFFVIGYFPTLLWRDPRVALVLAAALSVPFGSKSPSARAGAFRGAALGLACGLGICGALASLYGRPVPPALQGIQAAVLEAVAASSPNGIDALALTGLCAALGRQFGRPVAAQLYVVLLSSGVVLTALPAAIFAWLAQRRRQQREREWTQEA